AVILPIHDVSTHRAAPVHHLECRGLPAPDFWLPQSVGRTDSPSRERFLDRRVEVARWKPQSMARAAFVTHQGADRSRDQLVLIMRAMDRRGGSRCGLRMESDSAASAEPRSLRA